MSSIFHGQGIVICEGLVRGGSESPIPEDMLAGLTAAAAAAGGSVAEPPPGMRVMRFWVKEGKSGSKLVSLMLLLLCSTKVMCYVGDGFCSLFGLWCKKQQQQQQQQQQRVVALRSLHQACA
jgi:hypothetical protein